MTENINKTGFVPTFNAHSLVFSIRAGLPRPHVYNILLEKGISFRLELNASGRELSDIGNTWVNHGEWRYQRENGRKLKNPFDPGRGIEEVRNAQFRYDPQNPTYIICTPKR